LSRLLSPTVEDLEQGRGTSDQLPYPNQPSSFQRQSTREEMATRGHKKYLKIDSQEKLSVKAHKIVNNIEQLLLQYSERKPA
jgi:hypothetical protein